VELFCGHRYVGDVGIIAVSLGQEGGWSESRRTRETSRGCARAPTRLAFDATGRLLVECTSRADTAGRSWQVEAVGSSGRNRER
jgi:hypothetical protein